MRKGTVTSFLSFVKETENLNTVVDLVVFRGQPCQGNLLPGIARNDPHCNPLAAERLVFEQLNLLGSALLPATQQKFLDLLVLAQHYSLKTRLLEWTANPLVALWFACADRRDGDAYVYALEADRHLDQTPYDLDLSKLNRTLVFQPRFNSPRIVAQQGWFTLHRRSAKAAKFVALEHNAEMKGQLHEFRVPTENRRGILDSLDSHGVNARTVFPDLEGLCRYLNWKHLTEG